MRAERSFKTLLFDILLISLLALASIVAIVRIGMTPGDPVNGVAVIFPPWTNAGTALTRATDAGSRFVRFGAYSFIVVVIPERADYVERVSENGALMTLDAQLVAVCFSRDGR